RPVHSVRVEARTVPRQPRALGRRARERLAKRPHPPQAGGDARRSRQDLDVSPVGKRRPHRTRRWNRRDRVGRSLCTRCRESAGAQHRSRRARHRREIDGHRQRNLHLHQRAHRRRRVVVAIYLPETTQTSAGALTPRQIVSELDKHVVGQTAAKRAVAIALRNRMRRQKLPPELAEEIAPKNILMIGPTGVGKTEIARRLARLAQSPFIKVEASKVTEVGYLRRDGQAVGRDLVGPGGDMVREERLEDVRGKAGQNAEERLLDILLPPAPPVGFGEHRAAGAPPPDPSPASDDKANRTREYFRDQLRSGRLDHRVVEIDVREKSFPSFEIIAGSQVEEVDINIKDMLPGLFQGKSKRRKLKVPEALEYLRAEEEQKLIDMDSVARAAVERVEQAGIIFIDEIDKIAGREGSHGPDVSREGVQRDILPIVEGTTVNTKYGMVRTDHILFIAAGAFHVSKPSDLIPELQGRFPI